MAEQRRRTGLTSGINLLTNLLLQQQQDEMTRRRRAEELSLRVDLAFDEEIGKRRIQQGVNPRTGIGAIQGIPQGGGIVPEGFEQFYDAQGNLRVYRKPSPPKAIEPVSFDKEKEVLDAYAPGGVFGGKYPIDPSARKTVEGALEQGIIKPQGQTPEGVGSAIRSLGQTLLKSLPQVASMAESFTPAGIVRGIGTGIGRAVSPQRVAPIPSQTEPATKGGDLGDLVIRVQTALGEGYSPEDILDRLIQSGIDEATAQQIIQEASQ